MTPTSAAERHQSPLFGLWWAVLGKFKLRQQRLTFFTLALYSNYD